MQIGQNNFFCEAHLEYLFLCMSYSLYLLHVQKYCYKTIIFWSNGTYSGSKLNALILHKQWACLLEKTLILIWKRKLFFSYFNCERCCRWMKNYVGQQTLPQIIIILSHEFWIIPNYDDYSELWLASTSILKKWR